MRQTTILLGLAALIATTVAACGLDGTDTRTEVYEIDHYLDSCVGVSTQLCYRVRPERSEEFEYLYDGIGGFDYQWDKSYRLEVEIHEVENPPADGSSVEYELVEVISEESVDPGEYFEFTVLATPGRAHIDIGDDGPHGTIMGERQFRCTPENLCEEARQLLDDEDDFTVTFEYDENVHAPLLLTDVSRL